MYAIARDAAQDLADTLLDDCLELLLALDEQAAGEAHRVDAQLIARFGERVRLLLARDNVHVLEREDDVVRDRRLGARGAVGHRRRVPAEGREREVEELHEGFLQRRGELVWGAGREVVGEAADVVCVREVVEGEGALW